MNNKRSSTARIVSFIVLLGIIPSWFFYLGIKFKETLNVIDSNSDTAMLQEYLK
ncbi:hypothetical protein H7X65_01435 [Candidatus Parcubacteria bacterium]|nr:hypothetical protein [Candidatus Parcubacteria bacterium]